MASSLTSGGIMYVLPSSERSISLANPSVLPYNTHTKYSPLRWSSPWQYDAVVCAVALSTQRAHGCRTHARTLDAGENVHRC